ncbi:MAG: hypothetical protein ACJ73N_17055 [Bryobacteraceae bacterium]
MASLMIRDIGTPHDLEDVKRFFAERLQDILSVIQHYEVSRPFSYPKPKSILNGDAPA